MNKGPIAIRLVDGTELFAASVIPTEDPKIAIIHHPIQLVKFVDEDGTSIAGSSFMNYSDNNFVAIAESNIACITPLNKEFTEFYKNTIQKLEKNKTHNFKHSDSKSFIHQTHGTLQ
jgi:hypothetical protein